MPISIVERLTLYADQTGLVASLRAQPLKADGTATGSLITTGFVALGGANYRFAGDVPDDAECVRYEISTDPGVAVAVGDRVTDLQAPGRAMLALPNAAPNSSNGLPIKSNLTSSSLTADQNALLSRIAAVVGVGFDPGPDTGWSETRSGNTITRRHPIPGGGTLVHTIVVSSGSQTVTVTYE